MNDKRKTNLWIVAIVLPIAVYIGWWLSTGYMLKRRGETTRVEMMKHDHPCPEGCVAVIEPWGGVDISGWSRFCVKKGTKIKEGKWIAWSKGKPRIETYYKNGVKVEFKKLSDSR